MKKVSVSPLDLQKQSNHKQYMIREIYMFSTANFRAFRHPHVYLSETHNLKLLDLLLSFAVMHILWLQHYANLFLEPHKRQSYRGLIHYLL